MGQRHPLEARPPHRNGGTPLSHMQSSPLTTLGGTSFPSALSRRQCTHLPRVLNRGRTPSRGEDPSSPHVSNGVCSTHSLPEWGPAPTPAPRQPAPPRTPGMGGATPTPRAGRLGPRGASPSPGVGRSIPPASAPEWHVPASPLRVPTPLRRSDGSTGPRQGGQGGSIRGAGREGGRSGTVTCCRTALCRPGRL